jgi:hypothetical protein
VTAARRLELLEELEIRIPTEAAIAMIERLPRLKKVRDSSVELFAELCAWPEALPIEEIRVTHYYEGRVALESYASQLGGIGLSNLKSLEVYWTDGMTVINQVPEVIFRSPAMSKVEELAVATTSLSDVLAALARHGRKVRKLGFVRRNLFNYRLDLEDGVATLRPLYDFPVHIKAGHDDMLRMAAASLPPKTKVVVDPRITLDTPL